MKMRHMKTSGHLCPGFPAPHPKLQLAQPGFLNLPAAPPPTAAFLLGQPDVFTPSGQVFQLRRGTQK